LERLLLLRQQVRVLVRVSVRLVLVFDVLQQ
jgi:hypothetical protein